MPSDDTTPPPAPGPGSGDGAGPPSDGQGPPSIMTRQERRAQRDHGSRTRWYVLGAAVVVLIGVVLALVLSHNSAAKKTVATTTTTHPAVHTTTCPLTGTPPSGGTVPARPALAVKIGNYTADRPSAGLNQADVVFEEPVEGTYTRLLAVFQCQGADLVGDLRSARQPDVAILSQLSNPIFVHAGGIPPVLALLSAAPLQDKNILLGGYNSVIIHPSGRYAPYSTFTSTTPAWALVPGDTTPPAPIFTYSPAPPTGTVAGSGASVHVPFSATSDVTWTWNATTGTYLRSYSGVPDKLVDGSQTAATNVVVLTVPTSTGPWLENNEGGYEVEVNAIGTGPAVVLRNGIAITGTWSRSSLTQPATLRTTGGATITLQPGNTWEELAPQGVAVTTTAAPAAAPSATSTTRP